MKLRLQPKRFLREYRSEKCLNCNQDIDVSDAYCPNCGQRNSRKKISFSDLIAEFLSGLFAYDSRLRKSLAAIISSPGKISREYVEGKRVRYVNPFRFFISISIIFFLILSWLTPTDSIKTIWNDENTRISLAAEDTLNTSGGNRTKGLDFTKVRDYVSDYEHRDYDQVRKEFGFEDSWKNYLTFKFIVGSKKLEQSPADFILFILPKLPFILFVFVPVFTLLSWLFYMRKSLTYVDHLIFNFHELSLYLILLLVEIITFQLIYGDDKSSFNTISIYVFFIYHIVAAKNFYKQGYFKTILKSLGLGFLFLVSGTIFIMSLVTASLAFY